MTKKPTYEQLEQRVKELEKATQEHVKSHEELLRLRHAIESAPVAIGMSDPEGHHFYQNKAFTDLFEYETAEELEAVGGGAAACHDQVIAREIFENIMSGNPWIGEHRMLSKSGRVFPAFEYADAIKDDKGNIIGLIGLITDITERKRSEEALRESERRMNQAQQVAQVANWERDFETGQGYWSDEQYRLFGYEPHKVSNSHELFRKHLHPDDRGRVIKAIETSHSNGTPFEIDCRYVPRNGEVRYAHIICNVELDDNGRPRWMHGVFKDITDRKRTEETLLRSTELLDSIRDAQELFITDKDPKQVFRALLGTLLKITDSEYGFLDEVVRDENGRLYKRSLAISDISWDEGSRRLYEQLETSNSEFRNLNNLAGVPALTGRLVIANDPSRDPRSRGLPEGHPPTKAFMGIPMHFGGEQVGVAGVANRPGGYSEETAAFLEPFISTCASIIYAERNAQKEQQFILALRESEQRYRTLVESSSDAILMIDRERKIVSCNQAFLELFGYEKDEVEGKSTKLIHQSDDSFRSFGEAAYPEIERVGSFRTEWDFVRKDGTVFPVETVNSRIESSDGRTRAYVAIIRDISERAQADEALRESEERYKAVVEQTAEGIFLTDLDTNRIIESNTAFQKLLGYSSKELGELTLYDFIAHDPESIKLNMQRILEEERTLIGERKYRLKDGSLVDVDVSSGLITFGGEKVFCTVVRDISDRVRLEAQFQAAQRMESLGTLAGGIAHDFNNLLMGIQGRTSLMLMNIESSHPHFEHLKGIEEYVVNAADLTKQLLGFARGGKYEVKPTNLNEVIRKTSGMFGRTKKEIKIHIRYQKDIWTVEIDQGQIEQVLMNLYVNAWQAMPGGGELFLETGNVTPDESYTKPFNMEPGNYVMISVADTGVGMDEATRQRIFEPFFTTKEMGRGTGLGLASVYGIIRNHGGIIDVYCEKGKGTIFRIYLPASEKKPIEVRGLAENILKGTETVLLIDDEDIILDVGGQMLKRLGYQVLIAKSGKHAIEIYKKNKEKIDMVILDMIMPDMGGGEVYDRMKKSDPGIMVLLSSGYSIDGKAQEIMDRGCDGFIHKPFDMKQLSRKLRELLDKK